MAKITYKMFQDSEDNEPITPLDVIQGKNLNPPYGIVTASQPIELADQEGNIVKGSNADESSSKKLIRIKLMNQKVLFYNMFIHYGLCWSGNVHLLWVLLWQIWKFN